MFSAFAFALLALGGGDLVADKNEAVTAVEGKEKTATEEKKTRLTKTKKMANTKDKRVCKKLAPRVGTRIGGRRICMTQAKWDETERKSREGLREAASKPTKAEFGG